MVRVSVSGTGAEPSAFVRSPSHLRHLAAAAGVFLPLWMPAHAQDVWNRAGEVLEQAVDSQPMASLTNEKFLAAAQIGIAVAVDYNPEVKPIKIAADVTSIALNESVESADARAAVVATHLVMLNDDIARLHELKQRDGNLQSPEAQAILYQLRENPFPVDSTGWFLAKSVLSLRVVVATAGHFGIDEAMKRFFGERLSNRLHAGERAERVWISKTSPVRLYTNIKWKHLERLGAGTRVLGDRLMKAIVNREAKALGKATFGELLDQAVDKILANHPSHKAAVYALRSDLFNNPALLIPPAPAAIAAPPAAAIVPMPAVVMVPSDPVMRPAYVQHQVVEQTVQSNGGNRHTDEPPPSHGHNLPTGISGGSSFGSFSFSY